MIGDLVEIIDEGLETISFDDGIGVIGGLSDSPALKDIATMVIMGDLIEGDISVSTLLSLLRSPR